MQGAMGFRVDYKRTRGQYQKEQKQANSQLNNYKSSRRAPFSPNY